tara:strand:- start:4107 stop:5552 length:1446 start_codon:yes stop_codon:yes gene_type:complete
MVFYGYELPRRNNDMRLKNLKIGIENSKTKNLSNLYQQEQTLALNMDNLSNNTYSSSTSATPSIFTPSVLTRGLQKTDINEYNRTAITPKTTTNTPSIQRPGQFSLDELKTKLTSTTFGLKRGLSKEEVQFRDNLKKIFDDKIKTKTPSEMADLSKIKLEFQQILDLIKQNGITDKEEEIANKTAEDYVENLRKNIANEKQSTESTTSTQLTGLSLEEAESKIAELAKINNKTNFLEWFLSNVNTFNQGSSRANYTKMPFGFNKNKTIKTKSMKGFNLDDPIKRDENKKIIDQAYEMFSRNKSDYASRTQGANYIAGNGLMGGRLVQGRYYNSYAPNFGNLFVNQKSLKKNNLTVSRPYSKSQLLSKKNITPLLKKMIFDIGNTLEFDKQDYHNLQKDEKIIIEKIIRLQKDMKDVNIEKLLEDDDSKIKKRLEILVGEINAGNGSSLIKKEMKELLRKLYDNKAISNTKYQSSLKSINNI